VAPGERLVVRPLATAAARRLTSTPRGAAAAPSRVFAAAAARLHPPKFPSLSPTLRELLRSVVALCFPRRIELEESAQSFSLSSLELPGFTDWTDASPELIKRNHDRLTCFGNQRHEPMSPHPQRSAAGRVRLRLAAI
jgi:hypothetical protein